MLLTRAASSIDIGYFDDIVAIGERKGWIWTVTIDLRRLSTRLHSRITLLDWQ